MKYTFKQIKEAAVKTLKENPKETKMLAYIAGTAIILIAHSVYLLRLDKEVERLAADVLMDGFKINTISEVVDNHSRQICLAHFLEDSNNCALGARIDFLANKLNCIDECNKAGYDAAMAFATKMNINEDKVAAALAEGVSRVKLMDI